ncbi:MAG: ABC transporter ATP-binding protein [Desulfobacterales bacterium]|nr:MAG: ABC transporter ATP-binding protein [Desulfobacterales bacterium]
MSTLDLKKVCKNYGDLEAVKNLSFHCDDGQFLAILGPSGAGKTSTLRMIAGLEKITSGEILIDGRLINDIPVEQRNIAMAFERYVLYPHLTVFENIAFPLNVPIRKGKFKKSEIEKKVKTLTEFLEIDEFLDRNVTQLSGGQRQRVAFARAMIRDADVFLFDEPLAHLDAKLRNRLRGELKKMFSEERKTVIFVTHDFREATSMAEMILILDHGETRQFGSPDEIYHHPTDMVVADMVGDPPMNFLDCGINRKNGKIFISVDGLQLDLPEYRAKKLQSLNSIHEKLVLGIRPIYAHITDGDDQDSVLRGEVFVLEPAGTKQILTLLIGETRFKVVVDVFFKADIGERVSLKVDMDHIVLFKKETQEALTL